MQFDDRDAFVAYMTQGQPARPANILEIVAINQGNSPLTMEEPTAPPVSPGEIAELIDDGRAVIDVRSPAAFGEGHIPGAYNIQVCRPEFEQRIGWVVPVESPLLLAVEDASEASQALHKLAFVGLDQRVEGYLEGGMQAWCDAGKAVVGLEQISVQELYDQLNNGLGMQAFDVREPSEWATGHIEGAHMMSYKQLPERLDELQLGTDQHLAVVCGSGVRSSTACSVLLREGFENLYNVTGGMTAWAAAGLPMVDDGGVCVTDPA